MIWLLCFLNLLVLSRCQEELKDYTPTSAEVLPFQALILNNKKGWYTVGALISPNYVVTMANGIKQSVHFVVYLGLSTHPKAVAEIYDEKVQVVSSSNNVLIHEDYGRVNRTGQYIYDIGLLKLDRNATITPTVQIINLPPESMFPLKAGMFVNSTAFKMKGSDGFPAYASVQLRSQTKCKLFFGSSFLASEEICVRQHKVETDFNKAFIHLPLVANGYLIGLGRTRLAPAVCQVTSATCNFLQVYTSIENALDWIYENSDAATWMALQNKTEINDVTTTSNNDVEYNIKAEEKQNRTRYKDNEVDESESGLQISKEIDENEHKTNNDYHENNNDIKEKGQKRPAELNYFIETTISSIFGVFG